MTSQGFIYRRLARFMPCVFSHVGNGTLSLQNKYDMASLRDVFMSAHYWRAFEHLTAPPALVVDLGAHCGHFSVLCHVGALERFGVDNAKYILVEAMPRLIPQIRRVVSEAGFDQQVEVVHGLVGKREGEANFESNPSNLLASHAVPSSASGTGAVMTYRDLDSILPPGTTIDILKIDIEGSEHDLLANYKNVLLAANLLLIEVHGGTEEQLAFERELVGLGFVPLSPTIVKDTERLLCYGHRSRRS